MKFSQRSRFAGNVIEEEDAFAADLVRSGKQIIKLNRGDPVAYFPTPKYIVDAYIRALKSSKTGYSFHAGVPELREAIALRHKKLYNLDVGAESVVVTQGVSEAIIFVNSMLVDTGNRAVISRPYYPLYLSGLQINGGAPVFADYRNGEIDVDLLRRRIGRTKGIKYMIFANPSNPTGSVMERKTLKEIVDLANDLNILIISDEIYDEILYNNSEFTSISEVSGGIPAVIFGGASKCFDATGFRIGYALIPGEDELSLEIKKTIADYAKMRLSSNTTAQYAFADAIKDEKNHRIAIRGMVNEISERINFAYDLIRESRRMDISERPRGAFYLFPKVDIKGMDFKNDRDMIRKLLVEEGVQITRGSGFGAQDNIRIVSLPPKDILELAIRKIDKFLDRHSR
ncbi:pyridoxal phosphate-dependent aminotransferase [Candidatus Marsarchaeota archaeon]|nr:pyridoxal phosphate-dependent aminotransferase [Candidatus Marsarchaeota archaeon]